MYNPIWRTLEDTTLVIGAMQEAGVVVGANTELEADVPKAID